MLGKKSGVESMLRKLVPEYITFHCLNHRLELSIGDSVEEVAGVYNFKVFTEKLHSLYCQES